ncbi:MAG: AlkZ family DNA glycosylase [Thermoplasmata archaeon]|nr:MAG: AlkZ family DNA glycosylase [Thermoplasmata archaeon]
MKEIDQEKVNFFCMRKQHLADETKIDDIIKITDDIGGLHATSSSTTYLSLFVRTNEFQREDLDKELYIKRNLGRIRYVRGTMYVLPKNRIPTAFSAMRIIRQPHLKKYLEFHGITDKDYKRSSKQIMEVLKGRSMTVKEIRSAVGKDPKIPQALNLMCDDGQLIRGKPRGGWKSNLHTYHRMDEYFPDMDLFAVKEYEAKKEITLQYVKSFGPVTQNDASWWTKFTKTEIKSIIQDLGNRVTHVRIHEKPDPHYISMSQKKALQSVRDTEKHMVCLLPTLDPYIMGYKDRERYLDAKYYEYVFDRSGNGAAAIMVDGMIVGIWDIEEKPRAEIKLHLFCDIDKRIVKTIHSKAKNMGMFITGKKVHVKECRDMIPLTKRTAGSVMSPLKDC